MKVSEPKVEFNNYTEECIQVYNAVKQLKKAHQSHVGFIRDAYDANEMEIFHTSNASKM